MDMQARATIAKYQKDYPIRMVDLCAAFNIKVVRVELEYSKIVGYIKRLPAKKRSDEDRYKIHVRAQDPFVRRKFTIAHELSHYLLHKDEIGDGIVDDYLYRSGLSSQKEQEANELAARILMPTVLINKALDEVLQMKSDYDLVRQMAKRFEVSNVGMAIKLGLPTEYYSTYNYDE